MLRRFLLTSAVLTALAVPSWADYLIIRVNLSPDAESSSGPPTGGDNSGRPGAAGGGPAGLGGGAGAPPPPGFGGGDPSRGRGPGAAGGGSAGLGGGAGGGSAGLNDSGPSGLGGGIGGGSAADQAPLAAKGDLFIAALEVNIPNSKVPRPQISHKFGVTLINPEVSVPGFATIQLIKSKPLFEGRYPEKKTYCLTNKKYIEFAEWMLQHWNLPREGKTSMQTKFEEYLEELNGMFATLSPAEQNIVKSLRKAREDLKAAWSLPKAELDLLKSMPKIGSEFRSKSSAHFVVLHVPRDEKLAEEKLYKLETALVGLSYWFAVKGKPLTLPKQQFVCVLPENLERFTTIHHLFDDINLQNSDGFYSGLDNVMVIAPERVDEAYNRFKSVALNTESNLVGSYKLDFKKLLSENASRPHISNADMQTEKGPEIIKGQILAMAKAAALDEGETMSITNQVFQQLSAVSGMLPRQVFLPRSLNQGLASFFTSAKSSGDLNLPVLGSGIGGGHWVHLPFYRKLKDAREKKEGNFTVDEKTSNEHKVKLEKLNIIDIITDRQLDMAEQAEAKSKDFYKAKVQAESWALVYFLANRELDKLQKFLGELGQMPRDLDLSPEVIEQAFGRAFDLFDNATGKIDQGKLIRMEADFKGYLDTAIPDIDTKEVIKVRDNNQTGPGSGPGSGAPGRPGVPTPGGPGFGGGGDPGRGGPGRPAGAGGTGAPGKAG